MGTVVNFIIQQKRLILFAYLFYIICTYTLYINLIFLNKTYISIIAGFIDIHSVTVVLWKWRWTTVFWSCGLSWYWCDCLFLFCCSPYILHISLWWKYSYICKFYEILESSDRISNIQNWVTFLDGHYSQTNILVYHYCYKI